MKQFRIDGKTYTVQRLLGHGKGGYSYLVSLDDTNYVIKRIHHEPCSYYTFGNKLEAEQNDYIKLKDAGLRMPALLAVDEAQELILKEYIDGPTIYELILSDEMQPAYLEQVRGMSRAMQAANLNIDYFPTNFVVQDDLLYYIDYECNAYMEQWNFENWGIKYWSKTADFLEYARAHPSVNP